MPPVYLPEPEADYRYVARERMRPRPPSYDVSPTSPLTTTYNTLLFMLLVIFLSMVILIVMLCKLSQVQKSIEVVTMLVLNGHGA